MKVLLIEDHALIREGVKLLLAELGPDIDFVEARSCEEMLAVANADTVPDLAVLDLGLPGISGSRGVALLAQALPETPICVLSADQSEATISACIRNGARGYVAKNAHATELVSALKLILAGGNYVPAWALHLLGHDSAAIAELTPRQLDVLTAMVHGHPNKAIARELHLSESTVRVHVTAVLRALNASNRTEATRIAIERGLVAPG